MSELWSGPADSANRFWHAKSRELPRTGWGEFVRKKKTACGGPRRATGHGPHLPRSQGFLSMGSGCPIEFYHGTSLEAILAIQQTGFRVDLSGTNAGAALGPGVYITTTLEKALNYAHGLPSNRNPARGAVLVLEVDIGRCYAVRFNNVAECTGWQQRGYDSAWAAEGVIGEREENCVRDPARIRITNVVLGHTGQARSLGYVVRNGGGSKKITPPKARGFLRRSSSQQLFPESGSGRSPLRKRGERDWSVERGEEITGIWEFSVGKAQPSPKLHRDVRHATQGPREGE